MAVVFEVTSEMADKPFPIAASTICGTNFVTSCFIPLADYPVRHKMEGINRIKRESVNGFVLGWRKDILPEMFIITKVR